MAGELQDQLGSSFGRAYDRRFWLACNVGFSLCALGSVVLTDSWVARIVFGFAAANFAFEAVHKWIGMRRNGRWMDPSGAESAAELSRRRRLLAVMLPVTFFVGLIIGITT